MSLLLKLLIWTCFWISVVVIVRRLFHRLTKLRRFNLRTMLLAVTAVAVLLGAYPTISVWFQRRNAIQQVRWAFAEVKQSNSQHDFQIVRFQENQWIIGKQRMAMTQQNGRVTGIGYSDFSPRNTDGKELWVTPPGKWIRNVDEAIALIEPQFDTK